MRFFWGWVGLIWAQGFYGTQIGVGAYQYRTPFAQYLPRFSGMGGAAAQFIVRSSARGTWLLAPEFGYLLGHSRLLLDSAIYISRLTGRPLPSLAQAHTYTHYLFIQGALKYAFDPELPFVVGMGLQGLYLLGQNLMIEYDTPDGSTLQEWTTPPLAEVMGFHPRWIVNLTLHADIRALPKSTHRHYIYIQTVHQLSRYGWPTGFMVGLRSYWLSPK
ncbi:MAG: hypothetical protein ACUVRD_01615 [Bacteroidia bacterium]